MTTDSRPPMAGEPRKPKVRPLTRRRSKRMPPEAMEKWVALIKSIVEIAAVLIAAWWAYSRYFAGEAPSLEGRASMDSTLDWTEIDDTRCTVTFGVTIKNIGKSSFDVNRAILSVWLVTAPAAERGVVRIKPDDLMKNPPKIREVIRSRPFVDHYPPGVERHDDLVFTVPRDRHGPSQIAVFKLEPIAQDTNTRKPVPMYQFNWGANCETLLASPTPQGSPSGKPAFHDDARATTTD
jgi:hypothetical protein